jgi:hypothetical protein
LSDIAHEYRALKQDFPALAGVAFNSGNLRLILLKIDQNRVVL